MARPDAEACALKVSQLDAFFRPWRDGSGPLPSPVKLRVGGATHEEDLVFATVHTNSAATTVDRIIDIFPSTQQQQVRLQFSQVLEAVLSQALLPRLGGGRIAAFEIMLATKEIRRLVREGKVMEIGTNLEQGALEGKQSMNQALADLVKRNLVAKEEALLKSSQPARLQEMLAPVSDGRPR